MFDDFVYYTSLLTCIYLGSNYHTIGDYETKKNYATGLGIFVVLLISGHYLYHTILMVLLNVIIIKCCSKRCMHLVSLLYTWMHLLYLHAYLSDEYYVIVLHKNIALRLVGMAFEMRAANARRVRTNWSKPAEKATTTKLQQRLQDKLNDENDNILQSSTTDVIAYAFCYIGLHKGPYYRYKVYEEHMRGPFGSLGNFSQITEHKLKKVLLCLIVYSFLRIKFATEIYLDEKFYNYDAETRYLYNIPYLLMFFLRSSVDMLLCTCVCTEAGFGIYPSGTLPLPGHGPSTRSSLLSLTTGDAMLQEYNFSMLKCFENKKLVLGPRMKDTIQSWDMPTQYWFWKNIHKNVTRTSKEMRIACSFFAWTVWSGATLQAAIISTTLWVYIHIESEYSKLYNTSGQMKTAWDLGFSIMRMFCLIYLTPCFVLDDASTILRYYYSIFWVFHAILIVLIVGAIVIHKSI